MSSSFENESGIEFNKNINVSAPAFLRYDPVYSWTELSSEEKRTVFWVSALSQALYLSYVSIYLYMYVYEWRLSLTTPTP